MSSTPLTLPARGAFAPRFILPNELRRFALPDVNKQPAILTLVDGASSLIDQYCGRTDGSGQGSLVYTTYFERLLLQARGRNIFRVTFKPLVAVTPSTVNLLQASANNIPQNTQTSKNLNAQQADLMFTNYFYTGVVPNTVNVSNVPGSTLSPIIGASGRYGYSRRGDQQIYPDLAYGANILQIMGFFGGPPQWTTIDPTMIDFDIATGEVWVPAGLYLAQFTEVVIQYNSGYSPLNIPQPIKQATAMLVRNLLSRGGGTTGLRSIMTSGAASVAFTPDLIDSTIENMLDPFKVVMAY